MENVFVSFCEKHENIISCVRYRTPCISTGSYNELCVSYEHNSSLITIFTVVLCSLANQSFPGGNWNFERKLPSVGSTKTLLCHEPDFTMTGEPSDATCQENGIWTPTSAQCVLLAVAGGIIMLLTCTGIFCCVIYKRKNKPKKIVGSLPRLTYRNKPEFCNRQKDVMVGFEPDFYGQNLEPQQESIYYEIRDSYYERQDSNYYETPIH